MPRKDKKAFIDLDLVQLMVDRGDLAGTKFLELQMSGEPLLHPSLHYVVDILKKAGLKLGLSTNGSKLLDHMDALLRLDTVTVSVDSVTNYKNVRTAKVHSVSIEEILQNIKRLLIAIEMHGGPVVDIQLIEFPGWEHELRLVQEAFTGYKCTIRTFPDSYLRYNNPHNQRPPSEHCMCLNPWKTVSVQANGNVVPCCISQGDDIIYGNLYKNSLREIWTDHCVFEMRYATQTGNLPNVCKKCYTRNTWRFHQGIVSGGGE